MSTCPVRSQQASGVPSSNTTTPPTGPVPSTESPSSPDGGGCPYRHDAPAASGSVPANSELPPNQRPSHGQTKLLSTHRVKSNIPTADADDTWQYPSHQMFYNAMKRKGYNPREDDMDSVVAIHNAVNERTWQQILGWEQAHCDTCPTPKLACFKGRPNDLSPKARLKTLMGYSPPFDRHDWIVDRCGTPVRYVIDFYEGPRDPQGRISQYIDARPALDSPQAFFDRLRRMVFGSSPPPHPKQ